MNRTKKNRPFQNGNHGSTGSQKKNPSVESNSDDIRNADVSGTNHQEPPAVVESSDDKVEVVEKPEEPEEDDEEELGVYLLLNGIVRC